MSDPTQRGAGRTARLRALLEVLSEESRELHHRIRDGTMRCVASREIAAAVLVSLAVSASAGGGIQVDDVKPPASFEIPFDGPGELASIWSWGRDRPEGGNALVLTVRGESRRVDIAAPTRVRWRSENELLVEQFVRPVIDGSGTRIVRMNRRGEVLEIVSDRKGLAHAEPSPDGRWVALERYDTKGLRSLEIRDLEAGFRLHVNHPAPPDFERGVLATGTIWSADGSRLAVPLMFPNPPDQPGRLYPRLTIVSRDTPGFSRLSDTPRGVAGSEPGGLFPLFWTARGIHARGTSIGRGLLLCDPGGSGCTAVYTPGEDRLILEGRLVGSDEALLLVKDFRVDPLEARAKEIHQVDLVTGQGRVIVRSPDGVFIKDIDWIQKAAQE